MQKYKGGDPFRQYKLQTEFSFNMCFMKCAEKKYFVFFWFIKSCLLMEFSVAKDRLTQEIFGYLEELFQAENLLFCKSYLRY